MPRSARDWKRFYAAERARLGARGLDVLLERAPRVGLGRALVFPHTLATVSGHLVAAVALALVRARAERVVALGVLHGGRVEDAERVAAARAGDRTAQRALRRVHDGQSAIVRDEFSLDLFLALLARAAARERTRAPRVIARFPFLVGDAPETLPGIDALARLAESSALVATTDPIHHGVGYGTTRTRPIGEAGAWARRQIRAQLSALEKGDLARFQRISARVRSDFRDVGPVLARLLARSGPFRLRARALVLVDYASALPAPAPTWVAAPLVVAS